MMQGDLFSGHPCPTCDGAQPTCPRCGGSGRVPSVTRLELAAREWMDGNPRVFDLFVRFARQAAERGRRFGIGQLAERVRWEVSVAWSPSDAFKVNNNHRAYVARRLIALHPAIAAFLETRRTRGECA